MKIIGFQKLTLLDYPEKVACTLFTGGCNLRCPFCQNTTLVLRSNETPEYTLEEIVSYLSKRKGVLDGVAITGGEPLINKDIDVLIDAIKDMGYSVKLDTNGCFPDKLTSLIDRKAVDYVAMDIKNSLDAYPMTVGVKDFDVAPVKDSVSILNEKKLPYEFRTTVVKEFHSAENFSSIGKWIKGAEKYYLQNFVDSGDLLQNGLHGYKKEELESFSAIVKPYVKFTALRGV